MSDINAADLTVPTFRDQVQNKWAKSIALASVVSIALGGFNDTFEALEKIADFSLSQLTDIPSHHKLERIYIRASSDVLNETFGAPVYIKRSSSDDVIKYYLDEQFILSAITRDDAIVAFLVFPNKGFQPTTLEHAGGELFFEQPLDNIESVNDVRSSYARTGIYYIEENNGGDFGYLYSSISGFSEFLMPSSVDDKKRLSNLTDAQMLDENVIETIKDIRKNIKPNFYGYSTLSLATLEDAILSNSEYRLIHK
ncbi:ETEC_3214 domain-containing protein [Photobacterium indicum]|uniref:Uncharacterized protein n=1 Tax=Photobacterium indicum TaxID=81447 RepID=A0A2T3LAA3_9GAMM|nr:ETEC_3214 domain-containing protein [Photobacterium indicum]PSV48234.1 hypothetical protein C9J47_06780 [Photobacterium indicum]